MAEGHELTSRHLEWVRQALFALYQDVAQKAGLPEEFAHRLALILREVGTADARFASARRDLQNIIWLLHGGVVMLDGVGMILSVNPIAEEIWGQPASALVGGHASELFDEGTDAQLLDLPDSLQVGLRRGLAARLPKREIGYTCNIVALQDRNGKPKSLLLQIEPPVVDAEVRAVASPPDESLEEALRRIDELQRAYAQDRQRWEAERDATGDRHDAERQLWSAERAGLEEDRDEMRAIRQHEELAQEAQAQEIASRKGMLDAANARIAELELLVKDAQLRAKVVGQELDNVRDREHSVRTEQQQALSEQLESLKTELDEAQAAHASAIQALQALTAERDVLRGLSAENVARQVSLLAERRESQVALAAAEAHAGATAETNAGELEQARTEGASAQARVAALTDERDALAVQLEQVRESVEVITSERDALTAKLGTAEQRVISITAERDALSAQLGELDKRAATMTAERHALTTQLGDADQRCLAAATQRDELQALLRDADRRVVSLLSERAEVNAMFEALEAEVGELGQKIEAQEAAAKRAEHEAGSNVETLAAELLSANEALAAESTKRAAAAAQLAREAARVSILNDRETDWIELVADNRDLKARLELFREAAATEAPSGSGEDDPSAEHEAVLAAIRQENVQLRALADESEMLREANRNLRMKLDALAAQSTEIPPIPGSADAQPAVEGGDDVSKPEMKRALRSARRETQTQRRRLVEALDAIQTLEVKLSERDRALVTGAGLDELADAEPGDTDPLAPAFDELASQLGNLGRDTPSLQLLHTRLTKLLSVSRASHRADQRQIETLTLALQTKSDEVRDLTADKLEAEELEIRLQSALSEVARLQDRLRDVPPKGLTTTAEFDRPKGEDDDNAD